MEDLELPDTKQLFMEQGSLDARMAKEQKEYLDALNKEVMGARRRRLYIVTLGPCIVARASVTMPSLSARSRTTCWTTRLGSSCWSLARTFTTRSERLLPSLTTRYTHCVRGSWVPPTPWHIHHPTLQPLVGSVGQWCEHTRTHSTCTLYTQRLEEQICRATDARLLLRSYTERPAQSPVRERWRDCRPFFCLVHNVYMYTHTPPTTWYNAVVNIVFCLYAKTWVGSVLPTFCVKK